MTAYDPIRERSAERALSRIIGASTIADAREITRLLPISTLRDTAILCDALSHPSLVGLTPVQVARRATLSDAVLATVWARCRDAVSESVDSRDQERQGEHGETGSDQVDPGARGPHGGQRERHDGEQ
jgi:hypothetical protein